MKKLLLLLQFIFLSINVSYGQFTSCEIRSACEDDLLRNEEAYEFFQENVNNNAQDSWHTLYLALETENRVKKEILADISSYLKKTSKSVKTLSKEIIDAGGYLKWKKTKTLSELESSIINSFNRRAIQGISESDIENIILNAQIIDESLGGNKFLELIDNLVKNDKFKNPEDLGSGLNVLVNEKGKLMDYLDELNEYEEGLHWIDKGEDVYISKKFGSKDQPSEIDVRLETSKSIVECKRISGANNPAVHGNIKKILKKFTDDKPATLLPSIKESHKNFIGQMRIVDGGGDYKTIESVEEFVKQIKKDGLINSDPTMGIPLENLQIVNEWHIITNKKRIIVTKEDWIKYE